MSFPRYPRYKDSGVEWLGEVPEHWEVRPLKQIAEVSPSNVDKKTQAGETSVLLCNYTDVYYNDVIIAQIPFMPASASGDQIERFTLRAGDTIITKDSETADDIAISAFVPKDLPGVVCGYHLSLARPRIPDMGSFLKRYFDSAFAKTSVAVLANGLTRVGLTQYAVDNLRVPLPPASERLKIASFLDAETAKIDTLISEQHSLIALLKEKRQVVISHAVTRGLDPHAPMKPSDVEWLGDVPAHWEVSQLRYIVRVGTQITYGIVQAGPHVENGVPYIRTSDLSGSSLPVDGYPRTSSEIDAAYARSRVEPGDLVIAIRASVGKCLPVPVQLGNANLTQGTAKIAPGHRVNSTFLLHFINSAPIQTYLNFMAKGATFREITLETLRKTFVLVPPLAEQTAIADNVHATNQAMETLIAEAERAIALLQERRAALISAAVTGKIDVRGLAT